MISQETGIALGPATVRRSAGRRALVFFADRMEEGWAELAVPYLYAPAAGDLVLTIGQESRIYIIGVIQGQGPSALSFPGDLNLSAPHGTIRLDAGKGVTLTAPSVELRGEEIEFEGKTLHERFENVYQWIRDLFHLRAGRSRSDVDGSSHQSAQRTFIRSEKETKIDGEKIHLG